MRILRKPTRRRRGLRPYAASTSALIFAPSRFSAIARSYWLCKFSQNAAPAQRQRLRRSAVSGETPRLPAMISVRRLAGTRSFNPKAWAVRPRAAISSCSTSPGCTGAIAKPSAGASKIFSFFVIASFLLRQPTMSQPTQMPGLL